MKSSADQLYELIPSVYRLRDAERGEPLKALSQVIGEQVDLVHRDIGQLYENWFIETAQDWVVPYLGELVGFRRASDASEPGDAVTATSPDLRRFLFPRREIANLVRLRRRKGTLAVLEDLASNVADWPARAVEFYELLGWFQSIQYPDLRQGRTVDLRDREALARLDSPFERTAHTIDVRRIESTPGLGRFNIPNVGLFVWRRKAFSVTQSPALCIERIWRSETCRCFTFSRLGHRSPLYVKPQRETDPFGIANEEHLPVPLRRHLLSDGDNASPKYYGNDKSLAIFVQGWLPEQPAGWWEIPAERILVCDLSTNANCLERYKKLPYGSAAVDPETGLLIFPAGHIPEDLRVTYHYSFSALLGGGEYDRAVSLHSDYPVYRFAPDAGSSQASDEADQFCLFAASRPEIESNSQPSVYTVKESVGFEISGSDAHRLQPVTVRIAAGKTLELRAANRSRPLLEIDTPGGCEDGFTIQMEPESRLVLDGLLVVARQVVVEEVAALATPESGSGAGIEENTAARKTKSREVVIRHCTFAPNGTATDSCRGCREPRGRLVMRLPGGRVCISDSIVGAIDVRDADCEHACASEERQFGCPRDPVHLVVSDSIVDGGGKRPAIGGQCCTLAHADLTIQRSTLLGRVVAESITTAEDSIFCGLVRVRRTQHGYMRFCYVPRNSSEVCRHLDQREQESRTPRRYRCQPETGISAQSSSCSSGGAQTAGPAPHIRPAFFSTNYGDPGYAQLALRCPAEISRGAEDESEMGVFHNLYHPQRDARLRAQLAEYTPANMHSTVIYADE